MNTSFPAGAVRSGPRLPASQPATECGNRGGMPFQSPVLMVDPAMLGHVEPHQPEQVALDAPGEQARDDPGLPGDLPCRGLRDQHRFAGDSPYVVDRGVEYRRESVVMMDVIGINADPVHVV